VNGKAREVPAGHSVADLLAELGLDPRAVAVEYNREILRREAFDKTPVAEGDTLEIVRFVQGG
jgi:thiamine biosynthesis protein ThiS